MQHLNKRYVSTRTGICIFIILLYSLSASGRQENSNWNQFRGPNGQGFAENNSIPVHFDPGSNVRWKTAVPTGHSSPVIWDDRIFLTAVEPVNKQELITLHLPRPPSIADTFMPILEPTG